MILAQIGATEAAIAGTLCGVIVTLGNVIVRLVASKANTRNGLGFTTKDRESLHRILLACTATDNDGVPLLYTPRLIVTLLERIVKAAETHNRLAENMTRDIKDEVRKQREDS